MKMNNLLVLIFTIALVFFTLTATGCIKFRVSTNSDVSVGNLIAKSTTQSIGYAVGAMVPKYADKILERSDQLKQADNPEIFKHLYQEAIAELHTAIVEHPFLQMQLDLVLSELNVELDLEDIDEVKMQKFILYIDNFKIGVTAGVMAAKLN